jgi:hypothetical protein
MHERNRGNNGVARNGPGRPLARIKTAGAVSALAIFAFMAVLGTANRASAAVCGVSLTNAISPSDPYQIPPGATVTITATIGNNAANNSTYTLSSFTQLLSCANAADFSTCGGADDSTVSYVGNIGGTCPVTWTANTSTPGQVVFTPNSTLTLAIGGSCTLTFQESVTHLSSTSHPNTIFWANSFTGACPSLTAGNTGSGSFDVGTCQVGVNKLVSCDGGAFAKNCSTVTGLPISVEYQANNTGSLNAACNVASGQGLTDTNLFILPSAVSVTVPLADLNFTTVHTAGPDACNATLAGNEPDTASLNCSCADGNSTFLAPVVMSSADFSCTVPGLGVTKTCGASRSGTSAVTVSDQSTGNATLDGCTLTDQVYAGPCADGNPTNSTVVDLVTSNHSIVDPTGTLSQVFAGNATGLNDTSCGGPNCCNVATITCDVTGTNNTIQSHNVADCPIISGDCFTRTPGFWGTHVNALNQLFNSTSGFGPVESCEVALNTSQAVVQGSATEDICSIGGGQKNPPQTSIPNTQRQLERECAAAELNLAVSDLRKVSCEGVYPGITNLVTMCCGPGPGLPLLPAITDVCNNGGDTNGCISALDVFNNFNFTTVVGNSSVDATDYGPPGANPTQCQNAKASGFVNTRNRP